MSHKTVGADSSFLIRHSDFENGGSPRIRTVFSPVKSRDFTVKVCNPMRDAKAELNRRSRGL
jgi:hypothetical protein